MSRLTESVGKIEDVLSLITGIAKQTNLLALNATIEATRAGEAGRGFGVVAGEVKELAKQTAEAAQDVAKKVASIEESAAIAAGEIKRLTSVIRQLHDTQLAITAAVEQQSAATNEISRSVSETAAAGSEIAENVAAVALAARNTVGSARQHS